MLYHVVYGLLFIITLLPLSVLYLFSDLFYFLVYYIFQYRKNVVFENLRNSFPEKSEEELKIISKRYFHHFADYIFETLKLINISRNELNKRIVLKNPELLDDIYKKGKNIVLITGHYGNWEWTAIMPEHIKHKIITGYQVIQSATSGKILLNMRSQFGMIMFPIKDTFKKINECISKNELISVYFLGDHRPPPENKYWTKFLNQDTLFYLGAEKIAVRYNMTVVFMNINKVKRGRYEVSFKIMTEEPQNTHENEITETYIKYIEDIIKEKPEYWLWSHRRWKYKKPENI